MSETKYTRHIGLRVDQDFYDKLHTIAEYEGRSINGEIRFVVQRYITAFEKKYGPIDLLPKK